MKVVQTALRCTRSALAIAFVAIPSVHAQRTSPIGGGSWIVGGSAGFSRRQDNTLDQSTTTFHVSPTALLFVKQGFAIGGVASLGYSTNPSSDFTTFGAGPSARYYFGDPAGRTFPFVSGTFLPLWQKSSRKGSAFATSNTTERFTSIDGSVGVTQLLATNVGLTGEAYYSHFDLKLSDAGPIPERQTSYELGVRFGIAVFVH
jgi:hypothetical protein